MKIVIILPTYNEKENIKKLIFILEKDIFPRIKNHTMYILVADDDSPDGTAEEVQKQMKKWKNINLSKGRKNGFGAAYIRGMNYAIYKMGADVLFQMDSDCQHDPHMIPKFLEKIDQGYDIVIGTRYSGGGSLPEKLELYRKILSIAGNFFVRIILMRMSIHDWTGGYRALRKKVFLREKDELVGFNGYIFQISFLHKAVRDGFSVAEIPYHLRDRIYGKSKITPLRYILQVFSYVIFARIKELNEKRIYVFQKLYNLLRDV